MSVRGVLVWAVSMAALMLLLGWMYDLLRRGKGGAPLGTVVLGGVLATSVVTVWLTFRLLGGWK